ncbi:MAG: 16S rRNA (cytosine(967)-C(5))-methyltransferase, partial [Gammaproteobacteria bacterium]|nr:16S rRNA (cytosine(967)-C(5))-methyltransferase [Gammaproteobacteria bacterium]
MADKSTNPRWLALKAILLVLQRGRSLDDALQTVLGSSKGVDERDLSLARALAYGVCRWYFALQQVINGYLRKSFKKKDKDLEAILLLGLYQLAIMKTEPHAAVNETVQLTQWQNKGWSKGLVNAVLRGLIRDKVEMTTGFGEKSYPPWLQSKIELDWPEQAESILDAGNRPAPMVLRVDLRQLSMLECIKELERQGVSGQAHEKVETALVLDKPCHITSIETFRNGLLSVQ